MKKNGFSLIEILIVITVFAALGILITQSIILTLQGSQKSSGLVAVRENLDFATGIIERQLRNADSIVNCSDQPNNPLTISYVDQNGNNASFSCVTPGIGGYIASTSAAVLPNTTLQLTSPAVISIMNCSMKCAQPDTTAPPYVDVSLTARPANLTGVQSSSVTTDTRIYLRNY